MQLDSIKLVLTDCDGVLTDGGVYYGEAGEAWKKFNIRDGMGVERLRKLRGIQTGIITGEVSASLVKRAEKLQISELHLGIKDKERVLAEMLKKYDLQASQIAYIGDDVNDLVVLPFVGAFFCPADAVEQVKKVASVVLSTKGGEGCFREMAELILQAQGIN